MSKMIKCKSCNADIASSAKVCPSCGAKNKKPIFKRWWFWVIIGVAVICIVSGNTNKEENSTVSVTKGENSQKEDTCKIGDTITTDKFEVTINGITTKNSVGNEYLSATPSEGGIYVCIDFAYKNITDQPISSFSCPQIKLVDDKGTKYSSDIEASSYYATETDPDRKILSDLNPGIKVKDSAVFEISQEIYKPENFRISVDADKDFTVSISE
ncbi:MAG: DUF4352 domain-containing protein [Clostridia bacterium]|nr:DUF4352 domain-containing protein [Clostridia bacterium]